MKRPVQAEDADSGRSAERVKALVALIPKSCFSRRDADMIKDASALVTTGRIADISERDAIRIKALHLKHCHRHGAAK